jgi:membrane-bound lytic murein transglycosylase D
MVGWFFIASQIALANGDEQIRPVGGSLWDYIESSAISQGLENYNPEGLHETNAVLPQMLMDQSISSADRTFYQDPIETLKHDPLFIDMIDPNDFDIPIVVNDDVKRWMNYMLGPGRKYYAKWLARSSKFTPMMMDKLEAAGLPKDLIYLSMIESGFSTSAYSSAAAAGLWQFIPTTGREMGLRVDWWIDERRDPEKSTDAAIKFMSRLYKQFDHWYLVWAGYNGGPGRVSRGIKKYGTRDFWELEAHNAFPAETDNYVPKIVAAAIIGKYRDRYGFTDIQYQEPLDYKTVTIDGNVGVDVLARCAGISSSEFKAYNPHLLQHALPPTPSKQRVHVPTEKSQTFLAELAKVPESERITYVRHVIQKGETLGSIARKYGVSVKSIQTKNSIHNPNRVRVGQVLLIPSPGEAKALVSAKGGSSKSTSSSSSKTRTVTHTIRKGENLNSIASKYGVSVSDIKRWNKISNANKIYAGQKLKIYTKQATWTTYTVRSGDNLSKIAEKYGCSVSDIKQWNNLSSTKIYVGQKLKIQQ